MNTDKNNDKVNSHVTHNININPSSDIQDYEIEVSDRKGVFSKLFEKLKTNRNQKLLNSGNHTKTTNRSISSLWRIGNIRASLFSYLDNVQKALSSKFSKKEISRNTLSVEIIGEKKQRNQEQKLNLSSSEKEVIVPPIIQDSKPKNNINHVSRIEVSNIDTSAITENDTKENNQNLVDSLKDRKTKNNVSLDKSIDNR